MQSIVFFNNDFTIQRTKIWQKNRNSSIFKISAHKNREKNIDNGSKIENMADFGTFVMVMYK